MRTVEYQSSLDAFHSLTFEDPVRLEGVYEKVEDTCRLAIMLKFEKKVLVLVADADHDTVVAYCEDADSVDLAGYVCINARSPWQTLLGQFFGWGWATINQQGYPDGVMLSFDGVTPRILLSVVASSLHAYAIDELPS